MKTRYTYISKKANNTKFFLFASLVALVLWSRIGFFSNLCSTIFLHFYSRFSYVLSTPYNSSFVIPFTHIYFKNIYFALDYIYIFSFFFLAIKGYEEMLFLEIYVNIS